MGEPRPVGHTVGHKKLRVLRGSLLTNPSLLANLDFGNRHVRLIGVKSSSAIILEFKNNEPM